MQRAPRMKLENIWWEVIDMKYEILEAITEYYKDEEDLMADCLIPIIVVLMS